MKRLASFIHAVRTFGLFVGFYLEKQFEHKLLGQQPPLPLLWTLAFLALIASAKIFEVIAVAAVDRWSWLRKKISGDNYIEGVWFNKVPGTSLYGLLRIEFKEGAVKLEGEQYGENATLTATWHSTMAEFDGSTLTYAYTVIYASQAQTHEIQGVSRISFGKVSSSGIPKSYNGHFQDIAAQQSTFFFTGFRVNDARLLHEFETAKGKHQAVVQLIRQFEDVNLGVEESEGIQKALGR